MVVTVLNKISSTILSVQIDLISYWNDFSLIPLGKCASRVGLRKDAKISNFENTLYSKSVSIIGGII